jgi:hypothetical protein
MLEPSLSLLMSIASEAEQAAEASGGGGVIYGLFNLLHQILRWLVLVLGVVAIARAIKGGPFTPGHRGGNIAFLATTHLTVIVGLLLWAAFSPMTEAAFGNFGGAMKDSALRFYAVEHPFLMILAAVLITVGNVKSKKADSDEAKHKAIKIFFTIGMLLILAGIPWSFRGGGVGRAIFHLPF